MSFGFAIYDSDQKLVNTMTGQSLRVVERFQSEKLRLEKKRPRLWAT